MSGVETQNRVRFAKSKQYGLTSRSNIRDGFTSRPASRTKSSGPDMVAASLVRKRIACSLRVILKGSTGSDALPSGAPRHDEMSNRRLDESAGAGASPLVSRQSGFAARREVELY